jgi:glycerophosphoryl diester phosphodiesterase
MMAKSMVVRFCAVAICMAATSALADVTMPHIVSHRGESQDRPENTMAAFRLAFERGVDGVECDVCCTSDGVPVIIHDSTTKRTAGSGTNLTVTASTWDQLKDVRVGAFSPWIGTEWEGETLPKFEDYLALLSMNSTTRCIVELKGDGANNLVQHVVAAVQAQPLATSNRVVFIAFDASLISAIRTALPDYQAWLLLNNGTYTGANLISRIEACNATGVDINYQASVCVSAADVAAVKAAGYSFAVWTCDSDDTAFTLAQNGVEEITTNRGGAMKTSLAAMIAAAPVTPPVPEGLERWGADRYVQSGLIAQFDGLENVAYGAQHSDTATQWTSITGTVSNLKFSFSGRSGSVGSWRPDGRYFDGNSKGSTTANITLGDVWTVQATTTMNLSQQLTNKTSPASQYPIVFAADGDSISAYLNNDGSTTTKLYFKSDSYNGLSGANNRASIATFGGRYLTAAFDRTGTKKTYFTQDSALGSGKANSSNNTVPSLKYWIGGTDENHYMKGTMHSLRIYNRLLTDAEMAQNREADEVRFRGDGVIVRTLTAGVEGAEPSGFYTVGGDGHEFSAPAEKTVGGTTWICAGYTLEAYNGADDTWGAAVLHQDELAYSYDPATGGRVMLTWMWTKKRIGYAWTGAAGDGKFSTPGNWADLDDGTAAVEPPSPGVLLSFASAAGGTITNDVAGLGGSDIVFPVTAGQYTVTGNGFADVENVVNESGHVQTLSNAVAFATTYNVALASAVNFAGGAMATVPGAVSGAAGTRLVGDVTFTGNWSMSSVSYTVPSGSRLTGKNLSGLKSTFTIDSGGYAHFAWVEFGQSSGPDNSDNFRINLIVNGTLEVDGDLRYRNNGGNATRLTGSGKVIAKAFYKVGGKRSFVTVKNFEIGAGSASSNPGFGATSGSNMLQFQNDVTLRFMDDVEFRSVYDSGNKSENGGISLCAGKTMVINTEDHDGNGHTAIWGCSFCVKPSAGNSYSTSNVRLSKQGKGMLIMRNKCDLTGSTGYTKVYHGYTDVRGGTLRVEEKGQLSSSALTVYGGARFELANSVALPNNTTLSGGGNSIDIGNSASLKLTSSSGDNATITMGTGSTLTGNVSLGTNTTVTAGANAKITGNVTLGTNSTLTAGLGATISGGLTMGDGTVWNLTVDPESATPVGGAIKLTSGNATIKVSGDCSSLDSPVLKKVLGKLDPGTDVANLKLDATGVAFPVPYNTTLKVKEDGEGSRNLVFRAVKKTFMIYIR